jgi:hypothetical protein
VAQKDLPMLYAEEILRDDFLELNIEWIQTLQTTLQEGEYQQGRAVILRFAGSESWKPHLGNSNKNTNPCVLVFYPEQYLFNLQTFCGQKGFYLF